MVINTSQIAVSELNTDLLVLMLDENFELFSVDDAQLQSAIIELKSEYKNKQRSSEYLFSSRSLENIGAIAVYPTNAYPGMNLWDSVKMIAGKALKLAADSLRNRVTILLNAPAGAGLVAQVTEGALLTTWDCFKYSKKKDAYTDVELTINVTDAETAGSAIDRTKIVCAAVNECRLLTLEPGDVVNPEVLADYSKKMADECGLECTVLNEEELRVQGYLGHIKVGQGSIYQPRMITMTYNPPTPSAVHLAIVGKGLCFDSGGISLKPAKDMFAMKNDKAGAAAVIATMRALAALKPDIKVTAIAVCAENMPGADIMRPGDIIRFKNDVTVHIENTDAEGRLCLADGLIRAGEIGATHIVDIATLTGSVVRALGESFSGIMGINKRLVDAVSKAGGTTGESYWKLPLPLEYREMLNCDFADLTNSAGPLAGATTAGLFLKEFVPEHTPWVHIDIAGTAWHAKSWRGLVPGASGVGVRTMIELACNWNEYMG